MEREEAFAPGLLFAAVSSDAMEELKRFDWSAIPSLSPLAVAVARSRLPADFATAIRNDENLDKEARRALAGTLATDDDLLAELSDDDEDACSYAAFAQLAAAA